MFSLKGGGSKLRRCDQNNNRYEMNISNDNMQTQIIFLLL